jgi:hypothetical protein
MIPVKDGKGWRDRANRRVKVQNEGCQHLQKLEMYENVVHSRKDERQMI